MTASARSLSERSPLARVIATALALALGVGLGSLALSSRMGRDDAPPPPRAANAERSVAAGAAPAHAPPGVDEASLASLLATLSGEGADADGDSDAGTAGVPRPQGATRLYRGALDERMSLTVYRLDGAPEAALESFTDALTTRGFKLQASGDKEARRIASRTFSTPEAHLVVTASQGESGALLTVVEARR